MPAVAGAPAPLLAAVPAPAARHAVAAAAAGAAAAVAAAAAAAAGGSTRRAPPADSMSYVGGAACFPVASAFQLCLHPNIHKRTRAALSLDANAQTAPAPSDAHICTLHQAQPALQLQMI
eukprot:1157312-Pelagomonas_calceolata.AAC.8